jgi:DNA-directed RNA polymerase specialized sigma24 family protein
MRYKHLTHMTHAEIAQALDMTEDAVKAILARAMRKIRVYNPELAAWLDK